MDLASAEFKLSLLLFDFAKLGPFFCSVAGCGGRCGFGGLSCYNATINAAVGASETRSSNTKVNGIVTSREAFYQIVAVSSLTITILEKSKLDVCDLNNNTNKCRVADLENPCVI